MLVNHTETVVLQNDHLHRDVPLAHSPELRQIHLEAAVAHNRNDRAARCDRRADCGGKSVAHCAEAGGGDEPARVGKAAMVGYPNLVLSDLGGNIRLFARFFRQSADQEPRVHEAVVVGSKLVCGLALQKVGIVEPFLGRFVVVKQRNELREHLFDIADEWDFRREIFADFRGVNVDVDNARVPFEPGGVRNRAVTQA